MPPLDDTAAIDVRSVSKAFRLPHERRDTIKEHFLHPLSRSTYERNVALDNVTLRVERGECFGVIGRNGSGKSTLLKIIAGIYQPDSGSVVVDGRISPFIELGVGFNPDLTGRDNIRINGTLLGLSKRELERRFHDIVAFAELERFIDQKLKNYSSGMQVRLAYAIAIQVDFDILLLDEVLAVGDQAFQEKCFETFEEFRRQGKTILIVSHDLASVRRFCDRALYMQNGVAVRTGPAEEVIDEYLATVEGATSVLD